MKVIHLNTGINESSAPYKLHTAMLENGIDSKILTLNEAGMENVFAVQKTMLYKVRRKIAAIIRKLVLKKYEPQEYMPLSILPVGIDVSKHTLIKEADVIMIHWVSADFMTPRTIEKLLKLGKPVFWTCHDNHPFTGGCHVRLGCERYQHDCGKCPQLQLKKENDITRKLVEKKKRLLKYDNLFILSPSTWMDHNVSNSIYSCKKHYILPNTISEEIFHPYEKNAARQRWDLEEKSIVILVGLKANEKIPYNGTEYIWKVLELLHLKYPDHMIDGRKIEIVVFGSLNVNNRSIFDIKKVGFISEQRELARLYSMSDLYLVTSLEDSFNQTVAECISCGTPVVAFNNGGIADIIRHNENGYLARYKDINDLFQGVIEILDYNGEINEYEHKTSCFSHELIANRFLDIVERISEI